MIKRMFLVITILLGFTLNFHCYANAMPSINSLDSLLRFSHWDNLTNAKSWTISIKKDREYDEAKDPALRKGTENWEEPQGSFFVVPAFVLGLIGIVLFFNKK